MVLDYLMVCVCICVFGSPFYVDYKKRIELLTAKDLFKHQPNKKNFQ